ncbi:MAG: glycosyltransferase [Lachnospiraceae bacterium]|nr:glycosyltransferase [Lachnospiraceae bacterium]
MLIFFKGYLETLDYFTDCMAELSGFDMLILDVKADTYKRDVQTAIERADKDTIVVCFNNADITLTCPDGVNLWEAKGVKLYNIMVDHPISFMKYLEKPLPNMSVITVDKSHKNFIGKYFPQVKNVHFLPHGGKKNNHVHIPYNKREIDVLYIGSCQADIEEYPLIKYLPENGRELYIYVYEKLYHNHSLEVADAIRLYLEEKQIFPNEDKLVEIIFNLHCTMERTIRRWYKLDAIRVLAENGIRVEIYGEQWDEIEKKHYTNISIHKRVSSQECVDLVCNSKLVLNFMPWFKDGSHERIYIAMLNEAICISDRSKYLEEKFTHGKDIVFFDYGDLQGLAEDIKYLLANDDIAQQIAAAGCLSAGNSEWKNRLINIINEDFENFV